MKPQARVSATPRGFARKGPALQALSVRPPLAAESTHAERQNDPIIAIATASGRGAVGIVRVSGKGLAPFVQALLGRTLKPREATYLPFQDDQGQAIDHGLALWFPGPHSYTGEDVLELQGHGGPVVMQLLQARCPVAGAGTSGPGGLAAARFETGTGG